MVSRGCERMRVAWILAFGFVGAAAAIAASLPSDVVIFSFVQVFFLPVSAIGGVLMLVGFVLLKFHSATSLTAMGPLFARLLLHELGQREDFPTSYLVSSLPAPIPQGMRIAVLPFQVSLALTGKVHLPTKPSPNLVLAFLANPFMRTTFLDDALVASTASQVVVLGAGFDTRAYQQEASKNKWFEVDMPSTQSVKKEVLARHNVPTDHVSFVSCDFRTEDWIDRLSKSSLDWSLPVFVLWEGVTYYMRPEVISDTLQRFKSHAASGSIIGMDFFTHSVVHRPEVVLLFKVIGEPFLFGINDEPTPKVKAGASCGSHAALWVEHYGLKPLSRTGFDEEGSGCRSGGCIAAAVP